MNMKKCHIYAPIRAQKSQFFRLVKVSVNV